MPNKIDAVTRSKIMAAIHGKNTKPEIAIRKGLHRRGYRYTLYSNNLPGKPDITLPKYRAVIFINGCFWHGHNCHLFKQPSTNTKYWRKKISDNRRRDQAVMTELSSEGWRILVVWECAIELGSKKPIDQIIDNIETWLKSRRKIAELRV